MLTAPDVAHEEFNNQVEHELKALAKNTTSRGQLERLGLIDPDKAAVIFEIQKHNPLLFDLVLKRNFQWQGKSFPRQVFETSSFFQHRL